MANKPARRKFRPPLKEGASLPCSQVSSASRVSGVSQEQGRDGSQSWLSQLTATDTSQQTAGKKPAAEATTKDSAENASTVDTRREALVAKENVFSFDDSLCSVGLEGENLNAINVAQQDDILAGSTGEVVRSPGSPLLRQGTQTHTLLSFCSEASSTPASSELQKGLSDAMEEFKIIAQPEPSDDLHVMNCSDSEDEAMEGENSKEPVSRFQRTNKPSTRRYDYGKILSSYRFGPQKAKKGGKNNTKTRTKKRVTLDLAVGREGLPTSKSRTSSVSDAGHQSTTAKGGLSVYDYQVTPEKQGEREARDGTSAVGDETLSELNNSNWLSKRTREEQVRRYTPVQSYRAVKFLCHCVLA